MKAKRPIAIPAYLREPAYSPGVYGLDRVVRILQIEARFWRREGNRDGAHALEMAAANFRSMGPEQSPATAFDWPPAPDSAAAEPPS